MRKILVDRADGTDTTTTPDTNHGGGSRIANQNGRASDQQLPAASTSDSTPGYGDDSASKHSWLWLLWPIFIDLSPIPIGLRGRTHRGSVEERSERPDDRITPDLHSAGTDSNTRNQREHEDRGSDVQRHSETAPEHTFDDGQDGGVVDDLIRSGGSRGKSWYSGYTTICANHHQLRKEVGSTGILGAPHLLSNSRRGWPRRSAPSKPFWNPSLVSTLSIRFNLMLR